MNRRVFALASILCLLVFCSITAYAAPLRLADEADLLSDAEEARILQLLDEVSSRHGMDVAVLTIDRLDHRTAEEYADDYYDTNGFSSDGILLLVSLERDWHISTAGYGITAFTDAGLTYLSDQFLYLLSAEEYGEAFTVYAQQCDQFLMQAETGEPYDIHNLPEAPFDFSFTLVFCLVLGFITALIATGIMKGKLKSVRSQRKADDYVVKGSMNVSNSRDLFLYSKLDRRAKPKEQSSGGSTTHQSSSGTTHGGKGGKF